MKNLLLVAAGALGAYLVWNYYQVQKAAELKPATPAAGAEKKEPTTQSVMEDVLTKTSNSSMAVENFDASPRAVYPTPQRLMVKTSWPVTELQNIARC